MEAAAGLREIPMTSWALSVREVDVLVGLRSALTHVVSFLDRLGVGGCRDLEEGLLLLDRLLGPRGATCEVPRRR